MMLHGVPSTVPLTAALISLLLAKLVRCNARVDMNVHDTGRPRRISTLCDPGRIAFEWTRKVWPLSALCPLTPCNKISSRRFSTLYPCFLEMTLGRRPGHKPSTLRVFFCELLPSRFTVLFVRLFMACLSLNLSLLSSNF